MTYRGCTSRWSCLRILFQGIKPYVVQDKVYSRVLTLSFCQGRPFGFSSLAVFFFLTLTFAWIALSGFQFSGFLSWVKSLHLIKVRGFKRTHSRPGPSTWFLLQALWSWRCGIGPIWFWTFLVGSKIGALIKTKSPSLMFSVLQFYSGLESNNARFIPCFIVDHSEA